MLTKALQPFYGDLQYLLLWQQHHEDDFVFQHQYHQLWQCERYIYRHCEQPEHLILEM